MLGENWCINVYSWPHSIFLVEFLNAASWIFSRDRLLSASVFLSSAVEITRLGMSCFPPISLMESEQTVLPEKNGEKLFFNKLNILIWLPRVGRYSAGEGEVLWQVMQGNVLLNNALQSGHTWNCSSCWLSKADLKSQWLDGCFMCLFFFSIFPLLILWSWLEGQLD